MIRDILFRDDPTEEPNALNGVEILTPRIFHDRRGFFWEVEQSEGFSQTNVSVSARNVLRGMHYQELHPQTKIIAVVSGRIFDAWVDLRRDSPFYGQAGWALLDAASPRTLVVPKGFAHGFLALSDHTTVVYRVDHPRVESDERVLRWDSCGIAWPLEGEPILSERDRTANTPFDMGRVM